MRGLPPWPSDFYRFRLTWSANQARGNNDFNIFAPGADNATPLQLRQFITDWATFAMGELLAVMPSNSSFVTCRLTTTGSQPATVVSQFPGNAGAFGGSAAINGALCMTWRTSDRAIGG